MGSGYAAANIREVDVASGFWGRCKALERSCYMGSPLESARVVTRELFILVGGYDESISSGEDFFITSLYRRHTAIANDDEVWVRHHIGRPSLRSLLRKKFSYGRTARTYLRKAQSAGAGSAATLTRSAMLALVTHWRLLGSQPLEYLCIFPLRGLELVAVLLGMARGSQSARSTPGSLGRG